MFIFLQFEFWPKMKLGEWEFNPGLIVMAGWGRFGFKDSDGGGDGGGIKDIIVIMAVTMMKMATRTQAG